MNLYKIKFIDFGFINDHPSFNTKTYMKLYFNDLYSKNIISEILLYTLFFYSILYPNIERNIIIKNLYNLINNFYDINNKNFKNQDFDYFLLQEIYKNIILS